MAIVAISGRELCGILYQVQSISFWMIFEDGRHVLVLWGVGEQGVA